MQVAREMVRKHPEDLKVARQVVKDLKVRLNHHLVERLKIQVTLKEHLHRDQKNLLVELQEMKDQKVLDQKIQDLKKVRKLQLKKRLQKLARTKPHQRNQPKT